MQTKTVIVTTFLLNITEIPIGLHAASIAHYI